MTERDWEASARKRLERLVAETVSRIRDTADQIERDAREHVASAADEERDLEFQTYPRVAGQVVHTVQTLMFNLSLESLIDAASDAEAARTERLGALVERTSVTVGADKLAGAVDALAAMVRAAQGWAEGSHENQVGQRDILPAEEQTFVLSDIRRMVNDAAQEIHIAPVWEEKS